MLPSGIAEAEQGHAPEEFTEYHPLPGLAIHVIKHLNDT